MADTTPKSSTFAKAKKKPLSSKGGFKFPHPRACREPSRGLPPSSPQSSSEETSPACLSSAETSKNEPLLHAGSARKGEEGKVVFTGSVAGLLKMKQSRGSEHDASKDMLKIEAMEGRVKSLFEDVATCINEVQGADLTIKGFKVLGCGLQLFALRDDSAEGEEEGEDDEEQQEGTCKQEGKGSAPTLARGQKRDREDSEGSSEALSCEEGDDEDEEEDKDSDDDDDDFCAGSTSCDSSNDDDDEEEEEDSSKGRGKRVHTPSAEEGDEGQDSEGQVDKDDEEEEDEDDEKGNDSLQPKAKRARVESDESEEEEEEDEEEEGKGKEQHHTSSDEQSEEDCSSEDSDDE
jgi:hypothetical protein